LEFNHKSNLALSDMKFDTLIQIQLNYTLIFLQEQLTENQADIPRQRSEREGAVSRHFPSFPVISRWKRPVATPSRHFPNSRGLHTDCLHMIYSFFSGKKGEKRWKRKSHGWR